MKKNIKTVDFFYIKLYYTNNEYIVKKIVFMIK